MKKLLLFFAVFICFCFTVKAQFPNWEKSKFGLQLNADYDVPLGRLSFTYKPAIAPSLSLLYFTDDNFTINGTIGLFTYKPKAEEFYYLTGTDPGYGIDTFSDYKVKFAYLGFVYNLSLTDYIKGFAGINFGAYYINYETTTTDYQISSYSGFADKDVYFSPKLGFSLDVGDNLLLSVQAKYNIFTPTGVNSNLTPAFNKELGKIYNSYSAGFGLAYKF